MRIKSILVAVVFCVMAMINIVSAELIRGIDIDFVTIGNAGNPGDTRTDYPDSADPYGCGAVGYEYQIGKYEITNAQWDTFVSVAGAPTGNLSNAYDSSAYYTGAQQPTNGVSWYEALQFCNYLTSGNKSLGAYLFSSDYDFLGIDRSSAITIYGTIYVLPGEDEWYKAAYYTGSGYSTYANGTSVAPVPEFDSNYGGWVGTYSGPCDVGIGTMEQNGTFDMMGNVWEWNETLITNPDRGIRGGSMNTTDYALRSSYQNFLDPYNELIDVGFRVASVPEPATLLLIGLGAMILRRTK